MAESHPATVVFRAIGRDKRIAIQQAMFLELGVTRVVRSILTREVEDLFSFRICSGADSDEEDERTWSDHASGKLIAQEKGRAPDRVDLQQLRKTLTESVEAWQLYDACQQSIF